VAINLSPVSVTAGDQFDTGISNSGDQFDTGISNSGDQFDTGICNSGDQFVTGISNSSDQFVAGISIGRRSICHRFSYSGDQLSPESFTPASD
jgi:hypothetical protein